MSCDKCQKYKCNLQIQFDITHINDVIYKCMYNLFLKVCSQSDSSSVEMSRGLYAIAAFTENVCSVRKESGTDQRHWTRGTLKTRLMPLTLRKRDVLPLSKTWQTETVPLCFYYTFFSLYFTLHTSFSFLNRLNIVCFCTGHTVHTLGGKTNVQFCHANIEVKLKI